MKKIHITLAVLSLAAIMNTACNNREEEIGGKPELGSDVVAFALKGASTRAEATTVDATEQTNIIPLGTDEQGNSFSLMESVIDLDSPITRGTPAYTENVRDLYGASINTYAPRIGEDKDVDFKVTYDESTKLYTNSFGKEIWPTDGSSLEFYMNMPSAPTGIDGDINRSGGKITFTYASPETAAAQQDILFTYRNISKTDYDKNGYADVLFHHALTGVKFATGNKGDGIAIKEVKFEGLEDNGTCTVTPIAEDGSYVDNITNYSSEKAVAWEYGDKKGTKFSSGTFGDPVDFDEEERSFKNNGEYPASFVAANTGKNNLNDADATQTFWLIPQKISSDVKLIITYSVNGGSDVTWPIDFGAMLAEKNVEWKAGQLRTYTIIVDDVNVRITDNVTVNGSASDGFSGSVKDAVTITNTGTTDAFIRAAIIGQWLDSNGNPVFGFTDYTNGKIVLVDSWYNDQFVKTEAGTHGTFTGLAGYKGGTNPLNNWLRCDDGYYYYTEYVEAEKSVPDPLFESYTIGTAPIVTVAGEVKTVYFVMEIATQAISAKKLDGSYYTWEEAWKNANEQE